MPGTGPSILVIGLGSDRVADVVAPLAAAGFSLRVGSVADVAGQPWALVISPPSIAGLAGLQLLAAMSAPQAPRWLVLGDAGQLPAAPRRVQALAWPVAAQSLVGAVQDLLRAAADAPSQPPTPLQPRITMLDERTLREAAVREREQLRAGRQPGDSFLASLRLDEFDRFRGQLPADAAQQVHAQVAALAQAGALADEQIALGEEGDILLLLPGTSRRQALVRLQELAAALANEPLQLDGQAMVFSAVIGYSGLRRSPDAAQCLTRAREARVRSALHLDLEPALWEAARTKPARPPGPLRAAWQRVYQKHLLVMQYLLTMAAGLGLPFLVYWWLGTHGMDVSHGVYLVVVVMLLLTAVSIWWEGMLALRRRDPPAEPAAPYPPASAIIAAYLPNEAPIIEDSVRAFLRLQYPGPLQVILAYNTPRDMPEIEERLQRIAREDPRFVPMRVRTSTSKAQNVNAALPYATGEFTAVFDADHQPDPDSFRRAWRWISHGADVVQGHCYIRNGEASWVARMVAVEFEQIYAVNHPGRERLHGFGIFGGSNGYWRSSLLRELRMHGFMLTEDIDSSMRAVVRGRRIVSDPYIVSRELAPETLAALTKQRLRWAQGWLQISLKWILPALRAPQLTLRQKLGMFQLLAWREVYPWVSMQIIPLVAWWAVQAGSLWRIDWLVPIFVVTTLFTLGTGPGQLVFAWRLADPQLKRHPSWFWFYLAASTFFYAGLKNAWNRIAHYKEWRGETAWVVTPRVQAKKP